MEQKIEIRKEHRRAESLKDHGFYQMLQILETNIYEVSTHKYYGLTDYPLVTEDGFVLSNAIYIEIAKSLGLDEIEVQVITGIEEEDVLRILNLNYRRFKKKKYAIAVCGEYISAFWDAGKGRDFYEQLPHNNVRDKIAYLLGVSTGTYQSIMKIYNYDPELLKKVDAEAVTHEYALHQANNAEVNTSRPKGAKNVKHFGGGDNNSNSSPLKKLLDIIRFGCISFFAEGYGEIVLTGDGTKLMGKVNEQALEDVVLTSVKSRLGEFFHYLIQIPGIGSLRIMGIDFKKSQGILNNNKDQGGNNGKIDWFE